MGFRQSPDSSGTGVASVETVPASAHCRPGDHLAGEVRLRGGDRDVRVGEIALSLVARLRGEGEAGLEFHRTVIAGGLDLAAGGPHTIPFRLPLPWETPLTEARGRHLRGMAVGLRTDVDAAGRGDPVMLAVGPLPSQQRVLDAFAELGSQVKSAHAERGRVTGLHQELPFHQKIEFHPPQQYGGHVRGVELTFLASPDGLGVAVEADRRGDLLSEGGEPFGRFQVTHGQARYMAWEHELTGWLQAVTGYSSDHRWARGRRRPYGGG
ncbi:sporulation protein [Actinomadura rugatobispora]|uniref:Sporulation protein n=1 Tax=Actinomadura rugatobispora TaxID=1994 RepID=A0ABW1A8C3_9ACTN|nr:sporulation protein [Actinomadura rugatobispora]